MAGGILLVYLATMILGLFGVQIPLIHGSGPVGILFSLFVVVIAALNLVLDFDFIEGGAAQGAPRYMEWYAAFGLMVTLIWLYIEILRLLAKLRGRHWMTMPVAVAQAQTLPCGSTHHVDDLHSNVRGWRRAEWPLS